MKVLYIGVYKDGTGWAHAAQDYILALDAAGIDVVPRAIKQSHVMGEVPERILELEQNNPRDCNVVIQNTLPHLMEYSGRFEKNIGLYFTETDGYRESSWPSRLSLMDELWVPNFQMVFAARDSGVRTRMKELPVPCDTSKYERAGFHVNTFAELSNERFRFYFIGEIKQRKNISALLQAFHLEFGVNEPVDLVIKANFGEETEQDCRLRLTEIADRVKRGLKLYPHPQDYKQEIVITQYLTESSLLDLHDCCDCFVAPSFGEAWCIPAFDAMCLGKTPIVNNVGGMSSFVNNNNGWLVDNHKEPVFNMLETFQDLYMGYENWWRIDVLELRSAMREAYENKSLKSTKSSNGMADRYNFSHAAIGEKMKECLYA